MEPKFRSSFIPKKPLPVKSTGRVRQHRSFNLITFLASIVFIAALGLAGAAFGYERVLENRVNKMGVDLKNEKEKLDFKNIDKYKTLAERLSAAQMLVDRHKAISEFFSFLSAETLHNVTYKAFSITDSLNGDNLRIFIEGQASTHNAFTVQADVFKKKPVLKNIQYSEIKKEEDGTVSFYITAEVSGSDFLVKIQNNE
jgi:hypothetical protein